MRVALAFLAAGLALAGCSKPKERYVDHAWVRLGASPRAPAAAYFTIHGGPSDATLIAVSTDVAIKAEMHESGMTGTMATMKPIQSLPVPAKSTVEFKPGGRHVMFYDMNPGIKPGANVVLTLSFGDGERILEDARAVGAGDPPPTF